MNEKKVKQYFSIDSDKLDKVLALLEDDYVYGYTDVETILLSEWNLINHNNHQKWLDKASVSKIAEYVLDMWRLENINDEWGYEGD